MRDADAIDDLRTAWAMIRAQSAGDTTAVVELGNAARDEWGTVVALATIGAAFARALSEVTGVPVDQGLQSAIDGLSRRAGDE